jgi:hypothetical protein
MARNSKNLREGQPWEVVLSTGLHVRLVGMKIGCKSARQIMAKMNIFPIQSFPEPAPAI